jgi:N-acetylneuraminate synthase
VLEKHFTLSRSDKGVDSSFSLEPEEFQTLVKETERAHRALGSVDYSLQSSEKKSATLRRSIYVVQDIKAGEALSEINIKCIRPSFGLPPKYYEFLIGRKVKKDLKAGTPVGWDLF